MHTKPRSERGKSMDRIMTLHPEGKCGVNIENGKYQTMRSAILRVVPKVERAFRSSSWSRS